MGLETEWPEREWLGHLARAALAAYPERAALMSWASPPWLETAVTVEARDTGAAARGYFLIDGTIVVAFRGTESTDPEDWRTDFRTCLKRAPFGGRAHAGFLRAWESLSPKLRAILPPGAHGRVWLTGHSMGGALAALEAADRPDFYAGVATFGAPRVFGFLTSFKLAAELWRRNWRVVNNNDLITLMPPFPFYRHCGRLIRISVDGELRFAPRLLWRLWDALRGRLNAPVTDGISDHAMVRYWDALNKE